MSGQIYAYKIRYEGWTCNVLLDSAKLMKIKSFYDTQNILLV